MSKAAEGLPEHEAGHDIPLARRNLSNCLGGKHCIRDYSAQAHETIMLIYRQNANCNWKLENVDSITGMLRFSWRFRVPLSLLLALDQQIYYWPLSRLAAGTISFTISYYRC